MPEICPRPEYPRPQMVRSEWLNLNGRWQFEIDQGDSGLERGLLERELTGEILVPFAPESQASGVENTDFLQAVWYRREVELPAAWAGQWTTMPQCGSTASRWPVTGAGSPRSVLISPMP